MDPFCLPSSQTAGYGGYGKGTAILHVLHVDLLVKLVQVLAECCKVLDDLLLDVGGVLVHVLHGALLVELVQMLQDHQ